MVIYRLMFSSLKESKDGILLGLHWGILSIKEDYNYRMGTISSGPQTIDNSEFLMGEEPQYNHNLP